MGEVASLRVVDTDAWGARLEWGGPTPLILPRATTVGPVAIGDWLLVMIVPGDDGKPIATMYLHDHLSDFSEGLSTGDRVALVIGDVTDLGVKAIVNNKFWGLLYKNELFQRVRYGERREGFVKLVRPDRRLDLTLTAPGYATVDDIAAQILARLDAAGGHLPFTDKSPPEQIARTFGVSKKQFKQAIGALYRLRLIRLDPDGVRRA